jgi:uncharacterized Ntn-hydrolase superfamily protein
MTFSIVARCEETGMFALAVSSSSPAVAARCAFARAGVGAFGSQNITDPRLGPRGLDLMAQGATAKETIAIIRRTAPHIAYRQLVVIDSAGKSAVYSGENTLGLHHGAVAPNVAAAGNMLASEGVPQAMIESFQKNAGKHIGDRVIGAMQAGLAAGGEAGPVHSAGMLIVADSPWPLADLRVDWSDGDPIADLAALWARWKPEAQGYVTRGLNPSVAPSFGVPGDP